MVLVGCGDYSERHVQGCRWADNTELVRVMDVNLAAARRFEKSYGIPATDSYEELLADRSVDAVILAVPHYLHAPLTIQAARAGKHVYCEKPMATTLADAREMIRVCRQCGVKLGIGFGARSRPSAEELKKLLARKLIGEISLIRISECGIKPDTYWEQGYTRVVKTDWRASKRRSGGGFFMMNAIHTIDLIRYITGLEFVAAQAQVATLHTGVEVEDIGGAVLRMSNGAFATIVGGTFFPGSEGLEEPTRLFGTHGQLVISHPLQLYTTRQAGDFRKDSWTHFSFGRRGQYRRRPLIQRFAEAIIRKKEPPITGQDGLKALAVVLAIYESSKTGKRVRIKTH